jgi:putative cell wall-binding protein
MGGNAEFGQNKMLMLKYPENRKKVKVVVCQSGVYPSLMSGIKNRYVERARF